MYDGNGEALKGGRKALNCDGEMIDIDDKMLKCE